jgi:hypothetical protein
MAGFCREGLVEAVREAFAAVVGFLQSYRWIMVPIAPSMIRMRRASAAWSAATRPGLDQGKAFISSSPAARPLRNAAGASRG